MLFDLLHTVAGNGEITPGCFLRLLDECMEHDDHSAAAITKESSTDPASAFGPEFKQAVAHGLEVGRPEQGTMVFQQVHEFVAARQQVDGPRLDLITNARAEVGKAIGLAHVSARATW